MGAVCDLCYILTLKVCIQESRKELLSSGTDLKISDQDLASDLNTDEERTDMLEDDVQSDQVPTLAIHEKLSLQNGSGQISSYMEVATDKMEHHELPQTSNYDKAVTDGEVVSPESRMKNGGKGSSSYIGSKSYGFGQRIQDNSFRKVCLHILLFSSNDMLFTSSFTYQMCICSPSLCQKCMLSYLCLFIRV